MAHIVAIQDDAGVAGGDEALFQRVGEGRFPGAAQPRQPEGGRALAQERSALLRRHAALMPRHVRCLLGRSRGDAHRAVRVAAVDHEPGGGGEMGDRVDQDEAARPAVALVLVA